MIGTRIESRWGAEETKHKLAEIQGQNIDLASVLDHFFPDHVHSPWNDLPIWTRLIHEAVKRRSPRFTNQPDIALQRVLSLSGIKVNWGDMGSYNYSFREFNRISVMRLRGAATPLTKEQLLRFQMVDFQDGYEHKGILYINTTKQVRNSHVYSVDFGGGHYPADERISEYGQSLITAMIKAKI